MTAPASDAPGQASREGAEAEPEERELLSYQGSRVPRFVILIWALFFIWGVVYLLRWIPESWREWFSR